MAQTGGFKSVRDNLWPLFVHRARHDDVVLKRAVFNIMDDTGPETFIRQEKAIMSRSDSRLSLGAIHCPTLVLVGNEDAHARLSSTDDRGGNRWIEDRHCPGLQASVDNGMAGCGYRGTARLDRSVDFIGKSTFDLVNRAAIDRNRPSSSLEKGCHCIAEPSCSIVTCYLLDQVPVACNSRSTIGR
jgi:hypothetical protein